LKTTKLETLYVAWNHVLYTFRKNFSSNNLDTAPCSAISQSFLSCSICISVLQPWLHASNSRWKNFLITCSSGPQLQQ